MRVIFKMTFLPSTSLPHAGPTIPRPFPQTLNSLHMRPKFTPNLRAQRPCTSMDTIPPRVHKVRSAPLMTCVPVNSPASICTVGSMLFDNQRPTLCPKSTGQISVPLRCTPRPSHFSLITQTLIPFSSTFDYSLCLHLFPLLLPN